MKSCLFKIMDVFFEWKINKLIKMSIIHEKTNLLLIFL
jgi:hypothetical protein